MWCVPLAHSPKTHDNYHSVPPPLPSPPLPCRHELQERDMQLETGGLRSELSRANDLVASLERRGGEMLPLSPVAAQAASLFKSGMSITQLYSKYIEVRDQSLMLTECMLVSNLQTQTTSICC